MSRLGKDQNQEGGEASTNIQAGRNVTYNGLSFSEARQLAEDVFKSNFIELKNAAAELVLDRVEMLISEMMNEAIRRGLSEMPEAANPDFQVALYTAQREYARSGDRDLGKVLVQLLVDRAETEQRNLKQIVLNESISVVSKLTPDQLDMLSLIFLLRYTVSQSTDSFAKFLVHLNGQIAPFVPQVQTSDLLFQHLEFAGCGNLSIGSIELEKIILGNYGSIFSKGFSKEELDAIELRESVRASVITICPNDNSLLRVDLSAGEDVTKILEKAGATAEETEQLKILHESKMQSEAEVRSTISSVYTSYEKLRSVWNDTSAKHMNLTSVGIAIGHANAKRRLGSFTDLSIWIPD